MSPSSRAALSIARKTAWHVPTLERASRPEVSASERKLLTWAFDSRRTFTAPSRGRMWVSTIARYDSTVNGFAAALTVWSQWAAYSLTVMLASTIGADRGWRDPGITFASSSSASRLVSHVTHRRMPAVSR
jgi:hypothetical protein